MTDEERKSTIDQDYIPNMMRDGLMDAAIERERQAMLKVLGVAFIAHRSRTIVEGHWQSITRVLYHREKRATRMKKPPRG